MQTLLRRLIADVGEARISGDADITIASIEVDSRRVGRGALFACLRGLRDDGHAYARQAVESGAAALLAEHAVDAPASTTVAYVPDSLAALSPVCAAFYERPSLSLSCVGITGTNGKTTTAHLLESISKAAGTPYGIVGTLGARLAGRFEVPLDNTTPLALELQRLLARFRDAGAAGVALEVSSHALSLHRVDDVDFDVAVLTNVSHDHLDFHASFEEYRAAKRRLFEMTSRGGRKAPGTCVLNIDDVEGRHIFGQLATRKLSYGIDDASAMLRATDITPHATQSTFWVKALRPSAFRLRLPGRFNISNAMAAIGAACALDIDVEAIAEGLEAVSEVPGRMTALAAGDVGVYVDYAHTPDGLRRVLETLRALTAGRLICVFGCGGDRDRHKRPLMGRVAEQLADAVILTSDNPRSEDAGRIVEDIAAGMRCRGSGAYSIEIDRARAIDAALAGARPGDVVLIAGKGHELYQQIGGQRLPFSDVEVARQSIARHLR